MTPCWLLYQNTVGAGLPTRNTGTGQCGSRHRGSQIIKIRQGGLQPMGPGNQARWIQPHPKRCLLFINLYFVRLLRAVDSVQQTPITLPREANQRPPAPVPSPVEPDRRSPIYPECFPGQPSVHSHTNDPAPPTQWCRITKRVEDTGCDALVGAN